MNQVLKMWYIFNVHPQTFINYFRENRIISGGTEVNHDKNFISPEVVRKSQFS